MRYKKFLLGVIAGVLCLGILNGCSGYSHDFNSSEEAQKYVLAKLKDKYNEEFIITEVKKYKEEKIGLNWIIAEVSSKENSSQTATVYTRNTGLFKDSYHVYYYSDEIKELIVKGASTIEIRKKAQEQNYKPLVIDGIRKIMNGETTLEELNRQLILY